MKVIKIIITSSYRLVLGLIIGCITNGVAVKAHADEVMFNTDVLDVNDRDNIDLSKFARGGYIMPGSYVMAVQINQREFEDQSITFSSSKVNPGASEACITHELVEFMGLKKEAKSKLNWSDSGTCLVVSSLEGMSVKGDLGTSTLYISIPQAYLEYVSNYWDPPSQWDNGISGVLLDYNINTQTQRQYQSGEQNYSASGNGTVGANMGAWRLRADWQAQWDRQTGTKNGDWSRYYAYRAIKDLNAKMLMGNVFLSSDIFDSFRFAGVSLVTDDNMLPPNLRGYAPEVTGIAKTNAKVVISQQGRILQETQVAAGPFRIQDINNAVSGKLDISVEEQDGSVQKFNVDTANVPYLTRPGTVRYKLSSGRPTDNKNQVNGPLFLTGEFSWGINNGWSLYGGGVASSDYDSLALGVGRDLRILGAMSFDVTQSRASPSFSDETLVGGSYRLSYSKRFDEYDSQITFAGYRFSQKDFMSMNDFVNAESFGRRSQNNKELYTITFNKQFRDLGISAYLRYYHQNYWNRPSNDNYNFTLARYFDVGRFKNINLSMSAYRDKYNNTNDDGIYLSLSIPWGSNSTVSYNSNFNRNDNTHQVSYYHQNKDSDSYVLSSGVARSGVLASGYYSHQGKIGQMNANVSYQEGHYSAAGVSLQGGATATFEGAALHSSGMMGSTRLLLDTDGIAGIPILGYGTSIESNRFGKAVISDVGNFQRSYVSIDLENMPERTEISRSVIHSTLTEGAIGYRKFEVIAGERTMAVIRLADGSTPPFGATVLNKKQRDVGIVSDEGRVYLVGFNAGESMVVHWGGMAKCELELPATLSNFGQTELLLPCHLLSENKS